MELTGLRVCLVSSGGGGLEAVHSYLIGAGATAVTASTVAEIIPAAARCDLFVMVDDLDKTTLDAALRAVAKAGVPSVLVTAHEALAATAQRAGVSVTPPPVWGWSLLATTQTDGTRDSPASDPELPFTD